MSETQQPTHALVPLALWQQVQNYIRAVPTGSVPLEQAAQLMNAMRQVQGVVHKPVSEVPGDGTSAEAQGGLTGVTSDLS